jgi:hypothetical protein
MTTERRIAQLFRMDDEVWARHASGWSVWTRVATLPVLLLAVWSHAWLGGWALLPVTIVLLWTWLNPRLFPPPRTTRTWAAKATFGERLWLNRDRVPIPVHHRIVPHVLTGVAAMGFAVAVGGALANAIWLTLLGTVLSYAGKLWFCDRMVWLYEEMKDLHPEYRQWLR